MDNGDLYRQLYTLLEQNVFYGDRLEERQFVTLLAPGQFVSTKLKKTSPDDQHNLFDLTDKTIDTTFLWKPQIPTVSGLFGEVVEFAALPEKAVDEKLIAKLTKKLESASPYVQMTGSIPLSPLEYDFLSGLQGDRIRKVRHYHIHRGYVFSIDEFQDELAGLVMCEVEAGGVEELMQIEMPEYAVAEVTEDPFFTGGHLCRTSRDELARRLGAMQ